MNKLLFFCAGFCLLLFNSCAEEDPVLSPNAISYNGNKYGISFYTEGSTPTPTINWGGEMGSFSLKVPYKGVSVDANTGVVSWTKDLPLGQTIVVVIAQNSAGQSEAVIILDHVLEGTYKGGYNYDVTSPILTASNFNMILYNDGTLGVNNNGWLGTGMYTRKSNVINCVFSYGDGTGNRILELKVIYSSTKTPSLEGYLKRETDSVWIGIMKLNML